MKKVSWMVGLVLLGLGSPLSHAGTENTTASRIEQLQKMLEAQQVQMQAMTEELRALKAASIPVTSAPTGPTAVTSTSDMTATHHQQYAQQWKLDALADEVQALQAARGQAKGQPVYAQFKDGVSFEDGSGHWRLGIHGRVQADGRHFTPDAAAASTFSVRRARLGANLHFHDFAVRLEGEYAGSSSNGSAGLTYGHIDYLHFKRVKLRAGQFKPFYGLERAMSTNFTDFQERAVTDALLGSTFDRGVMVFGEMVPGVFYNASWTNGQGASTAANGDETQVIHDSQDGLLRVVANVAQLGGWSDNVLHVGGFISRGEQGPGSASATVQTEGRGYTVFSSGLFSNGLDRTRRGYELALTHGPLKLQAEHVSEQFDGEGFDRSLHAWYASINWLVTGETFASTYKEGMFGRLHPVRAFTSGGEGWGAVQLGARYSHFDGGDFVVGNAVGSGVLDAGRSARFDAWTLGAQWILTPNVRLVANYMHTEFDTPVTVSAMVSGASKTYTLSHEDALTMRAQLDF